MNRKMPGKNQTGGPFKGTLARNPIQILRALHYLNPGPSNPEPKPPQLFRGTRSKLRVFIKSLGCTAPNWPGLAGISGLRFGFGVLGLAAENFS